MSACAPRALWLSLLASPLAIAADPAPPTQLDPLVVTASPLEHKAFTLPATVSSVEASDWMTGLGIDLSETLESVPGVLARDRNNFAQDTQLSIRGTGARSTFGIRGIRLYVDGIPASQPDGQGQISHFNLGTAARVEVLRGPFSSLYGNSSGGVISLFTADGDVPSVEAGAVAGSFDSYRADLRASGSSGRADYNLGVSQFETDGFRDHAGAQRQSVNGKLNYAVGDAGTLSLVANYFNAPDAQDPRGLTREEAETDPDQAAPSALTYNTRKSVEQAQGGLIYQHQLSTQHRLRLLAYGGNRQVEQYLSTPPSAQGSPTASGGVVDLDNDYAGADARWQYSGHWLGQPATAVLGTSLDGLSQHRRGYENFVGDTLGVRGALRRDEINDITTLDQYLQTNWDLGDAWLLQAGLRHSRVEFESDDRYVTEGNRDDSDQLAFEETTKALGLSWHRLPRLTLYAAYGEGFETPTFVEVAYRPDGSSGLNVDLDASSNRSYELGAKWRPLAATRVEAALFHVDTNDELVVATNSGGQTTYQNAPGTERDGVELQVFGQLSPRLRTELAWTWLDARLSETYRTCTGTPCTTPNTEVKAGNQLAGVPTSDLYAALHWGGDTGVQAGIAVRNTSKVEVDDINSQAAWSFTTVDLELGHVAQFERLQLRSFVQVNNVFDEQYIGSVIVNGGNAAFYEPAAGTQLLGGFRLNWTAR